MAAYALAGAANIAHHRWTLERLSHHQDTVVRLHLARKTYRSATTDITSQLATDADPRVRMQVARSRHRVCGTALALLATDEHTAVRQATAGRSDLPIPVILVLLSDNLAVRHRLASNPAMEAWALTRLAADPSSMVRRAVAEHPNTTEADRVQVALTDLTPHPLPIVHGGL